MTDEEAFRAVLGHHRSLGEALHTAAQAVETSSHRGAEAQREAVLEMVTFMKREILPHALAEEETIYKAARTTFGMSAQIDAMVAEHGVLAEGIDGLAASGADPSAIARSEELYALFDSHAAKENEVVLPAIMADPNLSLAEILAEMHTSFDRARRAAVAEAVGP